jgi:hypothetical protein
MAYQGISPAGPFECFSGGVHHEGNQRSRNRTTAITIEAGVI